MNASKSDTFQLPSSQQAMRDRCFHPSETFDEFPLEDIEDSIPARFEKMVRAHPDRLAVKTVTHEFTFSQLNEAANRVASAILRQRGIGSEPIALVFEQGAPAILAILGTLKAGKFYVPLDPAHPVERAKEILSDSTAGLIVTHTAQLNFAQKLSTAGCQLLNLDALDFSAPTENPQVVLSANAMAYLVYTSGSAGQPKGVAHEHRYVLYHAFEFNHAFHLGAADRCVLISPWSFSGGGHIIHTTLLNGAALFPLDVKTMGLKQVARSMIDNHITIYHSTPTVLRQIASELQPGEHFPDVRVLRFGGEALSSAELRIYKDHFPDDCLALNGLASTECGIISRYFLDKQSAQAVTQPPAGFAAYGKEIFLLDDNGDPVGAGEEGEIAVKSRYLASGYWKQPELTARKFLPAARGNGELIYLTGDLGRKDAGGCLYHLGRKDLQMKIRGYRIEVAEVEAALLRQDEIKGAAVVTRAAPGQESRMIAYVNLAPDAVPRVNGWKAALRRLLPDYMIPGAFVILDSFPLTPTGKINRRLLPDLGSSRPDCEVPYVAPRNGTEEAMAHIWSEVLNIDQIGVDDDFFDLGGYSLAASRIVSRVLQRFQLELPLSLLFAAPSVAQMAAVIAQFQDKQADEVTVTRMLSEIEAMTELEARNQLADRRRNEDNK